MFDFKLIVWYRLKVTRYADDISAVDKLYWISENAKKYSTPHIKKDLRNLSARKSFIPLYLLFYKCISKIPITFCCIKIKKYYQRINYKHNLTKFIKDISINVFSRIFVNIIFYFIHNKMR